MIFKKTLSVINYLGASILLLLAFIGGWVFYPTMYFFRDSIRYTPVFWWWFDDSDDGYYGAEYWRIAKGITKYNFWVSYRWSGMRNPMWNAHTKIVPSKGVEKITYSAGKLVRNGKELSLINGAVFMYIDEDGNYSGNAGSYFSERYSAIGWAFIWFTKEDKLYWRFSFAKKIIGNFGMNIQIGAFYRYIFKIKFNKLLKQ